MRLYKGDVGVVQGTWIKGPFWGPSYCPLILDHIETPYTILNGYGPNALNPKTLHPKPLEP